MYYTHSGYRTSIFGKNRANYILICTVRMESAHFLHFEHDFSAAQTSISLAACHLTIPLKLATPLNEQLNHHSL